MPEGDTIRLLADRISRRFAGDVVERTVTRDPRLATVDLTGRTLDTADAYGKHLFVRFDDGRSLHAHLLMTGSFAVGRQSREPAWRRRIELRFGRGLLVGEDVPVVELVPTRDERLITDRLGPDLCRPGTAPDPVDVADRLRRDGDGPLAGAMLDQRHAAGWGNVYVHDVPFVLGVSPFQPVGTIDRLDALVALGIGLIRANVRIGRQNTTGRRLATDARWVHGVGRRPCPVCGDRLARRDDSATPWRRSITWCPACQPEVDRAVADVDRARRLVALHPGLRDSGLASP